MPLNIDNVRYLVGGKGLEPGRVQARPPFEAEVVEFLDHLSGRLLRHPQARLYPDLAALGFWCRKSSLKQMRAAYHDLSGRLGRGLAFHIAPSNVAVNFAYSLIAGLICGNANVVRLPSKFFPQVEIICREIESGLDEYPGLRPYIHLMRYDRQKAVTDAFSAACDCRVIWGGDRSIQTIRQSPLPPRAVDLAFSDRYSICIIQADEYLRMENKGLAAERFFNDTLLTDQNACSAPSLLVWLGSGTDEARTVFWREFHNYVRPKYNLQGSQAVAKLTNFCLLCAEMEGVKKVPGSDNLIFRVLVDSLSEELMSHRGHSGFFMEYLAADLSEILPVCGTRCQTISLLGLEPSVVGDFLDQARPAGVDRVVPMGRTLDFSLKWDGYDLVYSLTRIISR